MSEEKNVPYVVYEGAMARNERTIKRLVKTIILFVVLLFATNIAWLYYISQYKIVSYEQDGDGFNNVTTGNQGDINYVAKDNDTAE